MRNLDCRTFYFSKWILPKTRSTFSMDKFDALTIGYFDFVQVEEVKLVNNNHPLEQYIINKKEANINCDNHLSLEVTRQQFFAFTNIGEENTNKAIYDCKKLEKFWKYPSCIRYYSLLHIQGGANKQNIFKIIEKINKVFRQEENELSYNVVCYFSFDYSDIIVCTQNLSVVDFTKAIFSLNYDSKYKKLVRDSFSLLSIDMELNKQIHEIINNNSKANYIEYREIILSFLNKKCVNTNFFNNEDENNFSAAFNLGVQNYNVLEQLLLKTDNMKIPFDKYKMLGRHDVTLYYDKADVIWLIIMQNLIDIYSKTDKMLKMNNKNKTYSLNDNSVLFNCETYIRIPFSDDDNYKDLSLSNTNAGNENYESARNCMDSKISKHIVPKLRREHVFPIYALRDSILGLLKNGFAEDFVLCIYESFISFLDYIANNIENYENDGRFDNCFNAYFDNINALINSAMHSDRQFIQSPSFNPVFYDVPPKLMAYYSALTHTIYKIMETESDGNIKYSFMFRPSFSREININMYSYDNNPPSDRLLSVMINETDLYYPFDVISQLCHELAHYVGDDNRLRTYRKGTFLRCILYYTFYTFKNKYLSKKINDDLITQWVSNVFFEIKKEPFYHNNFSYRDDFIDLVFKTLNYIIEKDHMQKYNRKLFYINSNEGYLSVESEIDIFEFTNYINTLTLKLVNVSEQYNVVRDSIYNLQSVFSEIYADLQMVMILDLTLEEYIQELKKVSGEKMKKIHRFSNIYYRVFNIVALFTFIGKWQIISKDKLTDSCISQLYKDLNSYINYFSSNDANLGFDAMYNNKNFNKLTRALEKFGNSKIYEFHYWNFNIQLYLVKVYEESAKCYSDQKKKDRIHKLRQGIRKTNAFENAIDVFCNIQKTNDNYAEEIYCL